MAEALFKAFVTSSCISPPPPVSFYPPLSVQVVRKLPKVNAKLAARLLEDSKAADGQAVEEEEGDDDDDEDEEEGGRRRDKKVKKKQKAAAVAAKALSDPRFAALFKDEVRTCS